MPRKTRQFGWVREKPDARDHLYSVSPHVLRELPTKVDLRSRFAATVFDQGSLGSCGPQTAAADLLYDQEHDPAPDVMPSRLFIYYNTRAIMGTVREDSGVTNRDMLKALAQQGWCDEQKWPYVISQFTKRPPETCYLEGLQRKITQYLRVQQTIEQMKGCLAAGDPFIFGFVVYESMLISEVERTGDIPMPARGDRTAGGHDVLIVGYDDERQRFIFRNSWGERWGDKGHGTIHYAYATDPRRSGDFWTIRWGEPVPPNPPPVPPPPPPPPGEREYIIRIRGPGLKVELKEAA